MPIYISEAAAREITRLRNEQYPENPNISLRIKVVGGGCSGFTYEFAWELAPTPEDWRFEKNGVTIVIDGTSYLYTNGSTIDYATQNLVGGFIVNNPHSRNACGCGLSHELEKQHDDKAGSA